MRYIANNRDAFTGYVAQLFANGKRVEQGLCGVFVRSIARIDDVGLDMLGEVVGRTGAAVPHHDHVDFHGQNVVDRVEQRFAFLDGTTRSRKIHDIGRQSFFGQFKREPGSGRIFEENVGNRNVAERRYFLDGAVDDLFKLTGCFENELNISFGQVFDAHQMADAEGLGHTSSRGVSGGKDNRRMAKPATATYLPLLWITIRGTNPDVELVDLDHVGTYVQSKK